MGRLANLKRGGDAGIHKDDKNNGSLEPLGISTQQAADMGGIGTSTVKRSKKVLAEGSNDLIDAVDKGEVSVKKAASVVNLPKSQQLEAAG